MHKALDHELALVGSVWGGRQGVNMCVELGARVPDRDVGPGGRPVSVLAAHSHSVSHFGGRARPSTPRLS
eukprot:359832-Chlamydomonas_euryale.AAC.5